MLDRTRVPVTTTDGTALQPITFNSSIAVMPRQQYVIFASCSRDNIGHSGQGAWAAVPNNSAPGTFVFVNNGTDVAQWTGTDWFTRYGVDLAFQAQFDSGGSNNAAAGAPTASQSVMVLMALAMIAIAARILQPAR